MKIFKEAKIKDLLSQVQTEKITFSRMVELINYHAAENTLIEINKIFDTYSTSKSKEGGYSKLLRNKKKEIEQYLFHGDEKLKASWYVVADSPLHGWSKKAKEERVKLGLS